MKRVLFVFLLSTPVWAQELPRQTYSPNDIARALASCRENFREAKAAERHFPMPKVERSVRDDSVWMWLEQCVLETLEGRRVEVVPVD